MESLQAPATHHQERDLYLQDLQLKLVLNCPLKLTKLLSPAGFGSDLITPHPSNETLNTFPDSDCSNDD